MWGGGKISDWDRYPLDDLLVDGVNVVLELGGNWDNWGSIGDSSSDELEDGLVVLQSGGLLHQIDLVLQDDDVLQLHDFDSSQMFGGLWLRAGFVSGNQKKGGVHDGGTRQHSTHENIVTGAIDEATGWLE